MTLREAKQRAELYNAQIHKTQAGDLRCTLNEWTRKEREKYEYFTNDLDDAVITIAAMRKAQNKKDKKHAKA